MKKNNKIIRSIIIFLLFVFLVLAICALFFSQKAPANKPKYEIPDLESTPPVDMFIGKNAKIMLGTLDSYDPFPSIINESLDKTEIVKSLISDVARYMDYSIPVNSVNIVDNNIYIDFPKDTILLDPNFNSQKLFEQSNQFSVYGRKNFLMITLDSILKTLRVNLDKNLNVFYSIDSQDINVDLEEGNFHISKDEPYQYSK